VAALLAREHPMVCAVILSSLDTETASAVLSRLPEDLQGEVVYRLAIGQQPLPGVADEVKRIVASKLTIADQKPAGTFGSADSLADMLSFWKKEDADKVLARIRDKNEHVTRNIESRILTFDNLFQKISDDKSIQKILRNVDRKDLALALRKASPENAERVYKNMSQSAAQMLKEDMEAMGPQKLSIVEESQRKILDKVKRMLKDGEIVMSTSQEQEVSDLV
jgi:flagellar motor switch protein FliG